MFDLREPVLLKAQHFVLRDDALTPQTTYVNGCMYARNARGAVEKLTMPVAEAVKRLQGGVGGVFDIYGLPRDVTPQMERLGRLRRRRDAFSGSSVHQVPRGRLGAGEHSDAAAASWQVVQNMVYRNQSCEGPQVEAGKRSHSVYATRSRR